MRYVLFASLALAGAAYAQPVECYQRAVDGTLLLDSDALRLCQGASAQAPLSCYQKAKNETLLPDDQAITLCRCADSTAPVECYNKARSSTLTDENTLIQLCAPSVQNSLGTDCKRGYILPYGAPLP
jgi:hypothetical protein